MYTIKKESWGIKITFSGVVSPDEMQKWLTESKSKLIGMPKEFGTFVDARTMEPLKPEAGAILLEGQKYYQSKGMVRSAVIVPNAITAIAFKQKARESDIFKNERYISAADDKEWEKSGLTWIQSGIEPKMKK